MDLGVVKRCLPSKYVVHRVMPSQKYRDGVPQRGNIIPPQVMLHLWVLCGLKPRMNVDIQWSFGKD